MGTETKPDGGPERKFKVGDRVVHRDYAQTVGTVTRYGDDDDDELGFELWVRWADDTGAKHYSPEDSLSHAPATEQSEPHVWKNPGGLTPESAPDPYGKKARAEPVAALYEQGKVHHVGNPNCKRCGTDECELDRNGECWMCWQEQDEKQRVDAAVSLKLAPQPDPYAANQSDHDKTSTIGDEWPLERAQAAHNWLLSAAIALHEAVTGGDLHLPDADPPNALSECPKAMRPLLAQIEKLLRRLDG